MHLVTMEMLNFSYQYCQRELGVHPEGDFILTGGMTAPFMPALRSYIILSDWLIP